ncbi:uncharacterized protein [Nicotiana tomentosiformis]|uniref:uncharacterized protein n=1 Tax=Nicotiana tomentosiformis TaxID=4098 RepID=UPI00388CE406
MDCGAIVEEKEEEEEEDLTIQTMEEGVVLKNWTTEPSQACRIPGDSEDLEDDIIPEEIVKEKEVKRKALADHLAENSLYGEYEPLKTYFPDDEVSFVVEEITEAYDGWKMFFDLVANFKGVGIGAVLASETSQHYLVSAKLRFSCTNNMVEYEACILGLRLSIDMNVQELLVIGDSDLLVNQVLGEWSTKNTKVLSYLHCVEELIKRFTKIEFKHVPGIQNEFVDALATLSSMIQHPNKNFVNPILIGIHKQPIHADMIRVPPNELNAISSPGLFSAWGMDVVEPIKLDASNGHRFILVAIDYFKKWVKAASYKAVTKKVVADFVRERIVCRFRLPESIIADNAANLNSDLMKAMCETLKIKYQNSTTYKPQMNGAVKDAYKNIKKILRKMIDNYK